MNSEQKAEAVQRLVSLFISSLEIMGCHIPVIGVCCHGDDDDDQTQFVLAEKNDLGKQLHDAVRSIFEGMEDRTPTQIH